MVQKVQITLVDDVDGGQADETIRFALDGIHYEIDVSGHLNGKAIRDALAPWVSNARRTDRNTGPKPGRTPSANTRDLTAVRAWARQNGHTVSDRGRISATILAAYDAA